MLAIATLAWCLRRAAKKLAASEALRANNGHALLDMVCLVVPRSSLQRLICELWSSFCATDHMGSMLFSVVAKCDVLSHVKSSGTVSGIDQGRSAGTYTSHM
jgi:hypothetical protein